MAGTLPRTRIPRFVRQFGFYKTYINPILERRKVHRWWEIGGELRLKPYWYKRATILLWADTIRAVNFVETGTYLGNTTRELHRRFKRVVTIELSPELAAAAAKEFAGTNVEAVQGDSSTELRRVVPTLVGPTVFLLDAMWAGEGTAGQGNISVLADLAAIRGLPEDHVIVISDVSLFNGTGGYPTLEALRASIRKLGYWELVADNVILAAPPRLVAAGMPEPEISMQVQAS
jgi:hypothetical protein